MGSEVLLESDILLELIAVGSGLFGALTGVFGIYYSWITRRQHNNTNKVFLSKLTQELPLVLTSLLNVETQCEEYEKAIKILKKSRSSFTPLECNSFDYLQTQWDIPHSLFQHNKELAQYIHALGDSLQVISRVVQRTHKDTKEIKTQFENGKIDARRAIAMYENIVNRDKAFVPSIRETTGQGFVLWARIRNKNEDPQHLYNQLKHDIIEKAKKVYGYDTHTDEE